MKNDRDIRLAEEFTAVAICPRCHDVDVHLIRTPDKTSPMNRKVHESETETIRSWDEKITIEVVPGRWDEQKFSVIRICGVCGCEWGQR